MASLSGNHIIGSGTGAAIFTLGGCPQLENQVGHLLVAALHKLIPAPLRTNEPAACLHVIGKRDLSGSGHFRAISRTIQMNHALETRQRRIRAIIGVFRRRSHRHVITGRCQGIRQRRGAGRVGVRQQQHVRPGTTHRNHQQAHFCRDRLACDGLLLVRMESFLLGVARHRCQKKNGPHKHQRTNRK